MAAGLRLIADECISRRVVERLRLAGFDVKWIKDEQLGIPDAKVLERADFGELVIRQRFGVRGLILTELDRLSPSAEADRIAEVVTAYAEKLKGNLVVIEPGRLRIRPLTT